MVETTDVDELRKFANVFPVLKNTVKNPDPTTQVVNQYLFVLSGVLCASLLIVIVLICSVMFGFNIPLPKVYALVSKNFWIFAVVGPLEYLFFQNVGKNFVPVPKNEMEETVIIGIKKAAGVEVKGECPQRQIGCQDVWPCISRANIILYASLAGGGLLLAILLIGLLPSSQVLWTSILW